MSTSKNYAQNIPIDPSGAIIKYDATFKGIGPEVYFLPAPKLTPQELQRLYERKKNTNDSIELHLNKDRIGMLFQNFDLLKISNQNVDPAIIQNNTDGIAAFLNGNLNNSRDFFGKNLNLISKNTPSEYYQWTIYNMAVLELFKYNYTVADSLTNLFLTNALKSKNNLATGKGYLLSALSANMKSNFYLAESILIKKAIPQFNKAKSYENKILAWEYLAFFYYKKQKYTEAQWFLIQAKELAEKYALSARLPEIEYALAMCKLEDDNLRVSVKEFDQAIEFAKQQDKKTVYLAALSKQGEAYLKMRNYDRAETLYYEYQNLLKSTNN